MPEFSKDSYAWSVRSKPEPLYVKEQLSQKDLDVLRQFWEKTDRQLDQHRFPGQEGFKDTARQMGKPMLSNEVVRRVLKMNPQLFVEDSLSCTAQASLSAPTATGERKSPGA